MKKLIIKVVVMVGLMVGISNYVVYLMTGQSPFSKDDLSMPDIGLPGGSLKDINPVGRKETAYKWTDEQGVVHYSSEPPPDASLAEKMEVDPNTNLVRGLEQEPQEIEGPKPAEMPNELPGGNVYNPKTVKKLMDDAKNINKMMNERNQQLENL